MDDKESTLVLFLLDHQISLDTYLEVSNDLED